MRYTTIPHFFTQTLFLSLSLFLVSLFSAHFCLAASPDKINALYFPSHKITHRKATELIHYAAHTKVNAAVFHVKDPFGRIFWNSKNRLAVHTNAVYPKRGIHKTIRRLKENSIWTIAKVDVFADNGLSTAFPEFAIINKHTKKPWTDRNRLAWTNPFNKSVWNYNISLCKELAAMGFDEIQFDYIRFPSDGDLQALFYRGRPTGWNRTMAISGFLEKAAAELKPLGVTLSIDIFGLTAWKKDDFGVGQVLEKMDEHVDVICPMFYPSHFPSGFLGKKKPGEFPGLIMKLSMDMIKKRTRKKVRPWIQAFWYAPSQINDQIKGANLPEDAGWAMWNASGNYKTVFTALETTQGTKIPQPVLYASLTDMRRQESKVVHGHSRVVNYTDYKNGFSILSLETHKKGSGVSFYTPINVLASMDEAIMDQILSKRHIRFSRTTGKYTKQAILSELLCKDLDLPAKKLQPKPIHIDWDDNCRFTTRAIPLGRKSDYVKASKQKMTASAPLLAEVSAKDVAAALSPNIIRPFSDIPKLFRVEMPEIPRIN